MKRIMIFYGSYGGGHLSAARAIKEYFENNYNNVEIQMIDCIEYVNKMIWQKLHQKHGALFIKLLKVV